MQAKTSNTSPVDSHTKLCVLIGSQVSHSVSPAMHNSAFLKLGLNYAYLCFRVKKDQLEAAIKGIRALNIRGANVTLPHKQAVIPLLDKTDPVARKIGAVNTIVNSKGCLKGYNTDWLGAVMSLEKHTNLKGKNVVIVGAGGVARAIAYGLLKKGSNLTVLNRTVGIAAVLAEELGCGFGSLKMLDSLRGDILINATPVGMHPETENSVASEEQLRNFEFVFDTVYAPLETKLLRLARKAGCKAIHGLDMLVYQGAAAFELWTGIKPDKTLTALMRRAALNALETRLKK